MTTVPSPQATRLRLSTLLAYALPAVVMGMPTIPLLIHLPAFYGETLGIGLAVTGTMIFMSRLIDMFSDPVAGYLCDRFPTRFGRRKPWILGGGVVAGYAMFQLLIPSGDVDQWYLFTWLVVLFIGWTFIAVPYTAWGAELSSDYEERSRITGAREGAMIAGILIAAVLPTALGTGEDGTESGLEAVAWAAALIGIPALTLLALLVPERPESPGSARISLGSIGSLGGNKPFLRLLGAWFINGLANGIPAVLFALYLDHGLKADETWKNGLILAYFVVAVLSIPLWLKVAHRVDKHRVWCLAMAVASAAFITVPFIPAGGVELFLIVCVVTGAAFGADVALPPSMQGDVADYDRLTSGYDRAGQLFAWWSMVTKLALGVSALVALQGVEAFGFDPDALTEAGTYALILIYSLIPVVLKVIATAMVWGHPLDRRRHETVKKALVRRDRDHTGDETP